MRLKDVVELITVDMPDYTEGAFDIALETDDGGPHITIRVEAHSDSQNILKVFSSRFDGERILVMNVPQGYIHCLKECADDTY
jgi:hypothetical protein